MTGTELETTTAGWHTTAKPSDAPVPDDLLPAVRRLAADAVRDARDGADAADLADHLYYRLEREVVRRRWRTRPGACPACDEPAVYVAREDLFFHVDGTDNAQCWMDVHRRGWSDPAIHDYDGLYLRVDELARLPQPQPLIDGVLDDRVIFSVVGPGDSYKSFLALGWLASLATGRDWLGRTVEQRRVLYVVGEGAYGLPRRVDAWQTAWGATIDPDRFHVRRAPVNLFKIGDAYADLKTRAAVEGYGVILFDTLQRMTSGAERNSDKDAGLVIERLDELRAVTDGAVGIVAHTGKNVEFGTRGSSAWEDDLDLVWKVRRDDDGGGDITIKLDKRKDGPEGLTLRLRPSTVPGAGSLVLQGTSPLEVREPTGTLAVLGVLARKSIPDTGLTASALLESVGWRGKGQLYVVLDHLIGAGFVRKRSDGRWPTYTITDEGTVHLIENGSDLR